MDAYRAAAMETARFDELSNGGWFGTLPRFHGVYAWGQTREACVHALQADLFSAIEEALQNQRALPVFENIASRTVEVADVRV